MFRRWLSNFWKNNKAKIFKYLKTCIVISISAYMGFMIFSAINTTKIENEKKDEEKLVYRPTTTIASGKDLSQEEYEKEKNLVELFLEYCNDSNPEKAYDLLTDYCKEELYPNLETFKKMYYNNIFTEKRMYSLQSWIVKNNYHTYMIRFTNDALTSGVYNGNNVYQDYITIFEENGDKKISIGKYIKFENLDIEKEENGILIKVTGKKTYMDYIIYTVEIKNTTGKTISMDPYNRLTNTQIIMDNNVTYLMDWNIMEKDDFILKNNQNRKLELKFDIPYGMNSTPKYLIMQEVILNYEEYEQIEDYEEKQEYDKKMELKLKV